MATTFPQFPLRQIYFQRHLIAEQLKIPAYEVVLEDQLTERAFSSANLFASLTLLPKADQRRLAVGCSWINSWDGFNPVQTGDFARAYYADSPITLPTVSRYALSKFDNFVDALNNHHCIRPGIEVIFHTDSFVVPEYGCEVIKDESSRQHGRTATFFGYNSLIDARYSNTDFNSR